MKRIAVIICICCLLGGCQKQETAYRVVTAVEVNYRQGENTLHRIYTRDENITVVLNYLRMLQPYGPVNPEETDDLSCEIILKYSHGTDTVYTQLGYDYLRKDNERWAKIDNTRATLLYPLLLLMPSDQ